MREFEERVILLLQEVKEDFNRMGIPYGQVDQVKINKRAKARFGCCKKTDKGFIIEISSIMEEAAEDKLRDVIAHELLHTVRGAYDHGQKWKKLVNILNHQGYGITARTTYEKIGIADARNERYKYMVKCSHCGQEIYRKKRCPLTEQTYRYRCGKCGGKLKTFVL
ncbi:MAG: hypothetical protein MJ146_02025 [Clostridia bacterium]|nr:hypothetical protein [Clostridia bacterium]